ncbi:MAG: porin family protein [Aureibaculum sp.]
MKKILIITAIFLFGFTSVKAQEVSFGAKAGVNFATINSDNFDSFDGRTCFHIGFVSEIMISDNFAFQPELLYSCQGSDYSETFSNGIESTFSKALATYEGSIKLDYLNIPLMAKYFVAEGFSLEAGPQVGFLLSAKDEYDFDGDTGEDDIKEYVKGIDFGINFGIGYKLEGGLNLGARYNLGLTDINDEYEEGGTYKNGVFQVYLGYFF